VGLPALKYMARLTNTKGGFEGGGGEI